MTSSFYFFFRYERSSHEARLGGDIELFGRDQAEVVRRRHPVGPDPEELEKLLLNDKYTNNDRLRKVLLDWLLGEEPVPTWRSLCAALRTPSVNETRVARVIERERIFVDLELSGASSMFDVIRELCIGDMS